MYPGLSDADCRVAAFRYQQMLVDGQQQQVVAGARSVTAATRSGFTALREQVGALLVCAGQRLQGMQAATRERLGAVPSREGSAIA